MGKSTLTESAANSDSGPAGLVTDERADDVLYVEVPGGRIAYEVTGQGPLIVLSHGIGDLRQSYRFLAPLLVAAGYRVANGINPFTRVPKTDLGAMVRVRRYRQAGLLIGGVKAFHSVRMWLRYLDLAYPTKPPDWTNYKSALRAKLTEPGRMAEFMKTFKSTPADAEAQLPNIQGPALIVMGTADSDFPDPKVEGEAIVATLRPGLGTLRMLEGAGHYIQAERPDELAALVTSFLTEHIDA